jgi:hypothetical protein
MPQTTVLNAQDCRLVVLWKCCFHFCCCYAYMNYVVTFTHHVTCLVLPIELCAYIYLHLQTRHTFPFADLGLSEASFRRGCGRCTAPQQLQFGRLAFRMACSCLSEASVDCQQTTRRCLAESTSLPDHRCGNLRRCTEVFPLQFSCSCISSAAVLLWCQNSLSGRIQWNLTESPYTCTSGMHNRLLVYFCCL